jgi:hypothetical protein
MITKTIQIQEISVEEFAEKVADKLLTKIQHYLDDLNTKANDVFLTRTETAEFLKINSSTLHLWTKKGKIKSYGLGYRRYYNKKEIIELLRKNELKIYK